MTEKESREKVYPPYRIVYQGGEGEIVEKKSRFIATVAPVRSEAEAAVFIEAIRKKYYDARHHCPAFVIGKNRELTRCSDDGEPGGTAGKPILEVMLGEELTDTAIVVTRYFGGTLLGTGGLVRAYTQAARAGLAASVIRTMCYGVRLQIGADYTDLGKIQYILGSRQIETKEAVYTDKVTLQIQIPMEQTDSLVKELTEETGARAVTEILEEGYFMQ